MLSRKVVNTMVLDTTAFSTMVIPRRMVLNMLALTTVALNTMVLITAHARYTVKG